MPVSYQVFGAGPGMDWREVRKVSAGVGEERLRLPQGAPDAMKVPVVKRIPCLSSHPGGLLIMCSG